MMLKQPSSGKRWPWLAWLSSRLDSTDIAKAVLLGFGACLHS